MLDEMVKILPKFLGKQAHVPCFAHTVNLTAKGILRPFEPQSTSTSSKGPDVGLNELYAELVKIQEEGDDDADDDTEGFVEVLQDMTAEEREQWRQRLSL